MHKNFSYLSPRDMGKAGSATLSNAVREGLITQHAAVTAGQQWLQFCAYAEDSDEVDILERVTKKLVREYGKELARQVYIGDLPQARAESLLDSVNIVMSFATSDDWQAVNPTKDCRIGAPRFPRTAAPASLDRGKFNLALSNVRNQASERVAAIIELVRNFGITSREASCFDAVFALKVAKPNGSVEFHKGGDNPCACRAVEITTEEQMAALKKAAAIQGEQSCLLSEEQTWPQWKKTHIRKAKEILLSHGLSLADLRAAYACELYESFSGHKAPVLGGVADREADLEAREQVAYELGYLRIWETDAYLGTKLHSAAMP